MTAKIARNHQPYQSRQLIAKIGRVGEFVVDGKKYFIPEYCTFYNGAQPAFAAKFDRVAEKDFQGVLKVENVKEGEIILNPGFVYKKCHMTGNIMSEHLRAMRFWKPKTIIEHVKDEAPVVDVGVIKA